MTPSTERPFLEKRSSRWSASRRTSMRSPVPKRILAGWSFEGTCRAPLRKLPSELQ